MTKNIACDCGREMGDPICNNCRTKKLALLLRTIGVSTNEISHVIRDVKKRTDQDFTAGQILCPICCESLVSSCPTCYSKDIKNVIYFYFPENVSANLISLTQVI